MDLDAHLFELEQALQQTATRSDATRLAQLLGTLTINQACGTQGALWQSGYHDRAARAEEDLIQIARYIIGNPLRAGLVEHVGDYPLWDAAWL